MYFQLISKMIFYLVHEYFPFMYSCLVPMDMRRYHWIPGTGGKKGSWCLIWVLRSKAWSSARVSRALTL